MTESETPEKKDEPKRADRWLQGDPNLAYSAYETVLKGDTPSQVPEQPVKKKQDQK